MSARAWLGRATADHKTVRTFPAVFGLGAGLAVAEAAFDYTGGSLWGWKQDIQRDEYEHKEMLRTTRRRPLQETLEQLGEGRGLFGFHLVHHNHADNDQGIYGPGYEERRAQRIKENYGIDVPRSVN